MKHIKTTAMTLALLLAAATGAWAQQDDAVPVTAVTGQANQWQYTMPDVNVELTVRYFPTATFSEGGEPTAIEGVVAGTDNPIVTAASQQGTVMYYATTNAEATAPDYDAAGWSSTVPTAATVEGDKTESTEVYVYYYLKGNDAPEGQAATAENTFSDTDIFGPLTVTLKKNVFSVALRPLTQFTTDGGQATVTVDGQPIDNYSLKQGKTITVTAAEGYKIRSAKMGDAAVPVGEVISSDLGMLLGEDGFLYANIAAAEAAGTTAVAKIVYVGSNAGVVDEEGNVYDRGLAIDLMDLSEVADIPGAYCCSPSKAQWETMFEAAGTSQVEGYRALSDGLRESGGNDLYGGDMWGSGCYYSTDVDSKGKPLCFDFNNGNWVGTNMFEFRNIRAIASAEMSGDEATLNDAKTVATYTMPDHDATVKYLLARDLTQQVAFAGIPAEPIGLTMGSDGNYQPATPLDIQLNDAIAGANIIGADGLTVSYEKQDGDNWTAAADFLTDMQPGTYRIVAAATDEMSPYDGTLTSATFTLAIWLDEAADNSPVLEKQDGQQTNATLTRTLQTGGYNTFAAPFSMAKPEGWTVKELSSASFADGVLTLNFSNALSIEAGKPYLVKVSTATDLSASAFTDVTISKDAVPFTSTNVDFIPTLGATTIGSEGDDAKTVLFLGAGNKLYNPEALPAQMKGFRAYFLLKGETALEARAFRMDFGDGETTGIKAIDNFTISQSDNCYDLSGRKIVKSSNGKMAKGVYIVNGKKKVIK